MQAIILAGGKGTRLKPYTTHLPKPLVPVGDYPILEILLRQLRGQGFRKIVISTGHLSQLIQAYFGDGSRWNLQIEYVHEEKPLNTAGALGLVPSLEENFLVMNGDVLCDMSFKTLFDSHVNSGAMGTIAVTERTTKEEFGIIELNEHSEMTGYKEKPEHRYTVSMGVYAFSREAISHIGRNESLGMPDFFLRLLAKGHRVQCHRFNGFWLDIGRVDDYARAQEEVEKRPGLLGGSSA